ncbi:MAG: response regulator transcription factor [Acidobacteriota bacterium]|jgi:two-component system phosphate regulon response regulator PhoB/two-component system alkaline phosphatase synthesis response regulator PhoP|nr:response regulator transcription factor [Acidobacteriota bacterium]
MENQQPVIAAIEDEPDILELIRVHLEKAGFRVKTFAAALPFFEYLKEERPDLILLDLMLPDISGIEICRKVKSNRRWEEIPILMLTAKSEEDDIVQGLDMGADDYMVKPFSTRELTARVRAVLRRNAGESGESASRISVNDDFHIDLNRHEVIAGGEKIQLTRTEFTILCTLAERPGWVFSREKLLSRLWGDDKFVIDRTIDVHVKNMRDKLGKYGDMIRNVRGVGYKIDP